MRAIGTFFWRFMVIFSFIVNFVLIIVLLLAGLFIFQIKQQIADPLITGLHATSIGLDEATIDWTIPVRDRIPVVLNIPLQTDTIVVLTNPVPLNVSAIIDIPGLNASNVPAFVSLTLPAGLELPVALDLNVPVDEELDVSLDVRAVIPLSETQLDDPIRTLGLLFEPLSRGLHNLPNGFGEVPDFISKAFSTDLTQLLLAADGTGFNPVAYDPWPGYTRTAGLNYDLFTEEYPAESLAAPTGLIIPGGIPALDSLIRDVQYDENANLVQNFGAQAAGFPPETWNGNMAAYYKAIQEQLRQGMSPQEINAQTVPNPEDGEPVPPTSSNYEGIIPTPNAP